jgi:hypothetical protein
MASLAVQNNNPGDLKNPATGQFDEFANPQQGVQALQSDLMAKMTGNTRTSLTPNSNLQDFASVYAPASDGNDPVSYAKNLASQLGVPVTTPIGTLKSRVGDFAAAVAHNEDSSSPALGKAPTSNLASDQIPGQLTHSQLIANINAMEQQGAKPEEVQAYLDSLKGGTNSPTTTPPVTSVSTNAPPTASGGPPVTPLTVPTTPTPTPTGDPSGGFFSGLMEDLSGTNPNNLGTQLENTAKGVGNFLLPSVGDAYHDVTGTNTKTALQQIGDLGTSALGVGDIAANFVPGLGEVADAAEAARGADAAAEAGSAATKAPGILNSVLKGGVQGGAYGLSGGLGKGDTTPGQLATDTGVGAVGGGILGGGTHLLGGALASAGAEDATSRLTAQKNRLKTLNNAFNENSTSVTDPITTLDQLGLTKDLKVTNGKIDASKLTSPDYTGSLDNMIEDHSNQASQLVQGMKGSVPIDEFKAEAEDAIRNDPTIRGGLSIPKALANLETMMSSAEMSYGKDLPYTAIDEIRAGMNKGFNPDEMDTKRVIGNTARKFLYNGDGANTALKSAMQNESELIKARNFAQKLHGTTVPGGQLGKYFADLIGSGVGGAAGSMFGPMGAAVGTGVGGFTTHKVGEAIQNNYFNPLGGRAARGILNTLQSTGGRIATSAAKHGILTGLGKL